MKLYIIVSNTKSRINKFPYKFPVWRILNFMVNSFYDNSSMIAAVLHLETFAIFNDAFNILECGWLVYNDRKDQI